MKATISVVLDNTTMLKFQKKMDMIGMSEKDAIRFIARNGRASFLAKMVGATTRQKI